MGDPKKKRKKFDKPKKMWDKAAVEERRILAERYGLKNKKEIWRAETVLRKKRQNARKLLALPLERRIKREKELLDSLSKLGIMPRKPTLDDVLGLNIEALLERRLQTLVWRKGLSNTVKQARQLIVHGHISVNGKRVTAPGYIVTKEEEHSIDYFTPSIRNKVKTRPVKRERKKAESTEAKQGAEKSNEGRKTETETKKAVEKTEAKTEQSKEKLEEKKEKGKEGEKAEKVQSKKTNGTGKGKKESTEEVK